MTEEFSPFLIEHPLHSLSSTVNYDWNEDEASALCKSGALAGVRLLWASPGSAIYLHNTGQSYSVPPCPTFCNCKIILILNNSTYLPGFEVMMK